MQDLIFVCILNKAKFNYMKNHNNYILASGNYQDSSSCPQSIINFSNSWRY